MTPNELLTQRLEELRASLNRNTTRVQDLKTQLFEEELRCKHIQLIIEEYEKFILQTTNKEIPNENA